MCLGVTRVTVDRLFEFLDRLFVLIISVEFLPFGNQRLRLALCLVGLGRHGRILRSTAIRVGIVAPPATAEGNRSSQSKAGEDSRFNPIRARRSHKTASIYAN